MMLHRHISRSIKYLWEKRIVAGLKRVKETFTWEDKINQYLTLYENNVSRKRSSFGLSSDEKKCYRDYLTKTYNEGNLRQGEEDRDC